MTRPADAPLRMSLPTRSRGGRIAAVVVFVLLAAFVLSASIISVRSNAEQERLAARSSANAEISAIEDRMRAYTEVLFGVRSSFTGSTPTREEYRRIVEGLELASRYEGVQVIGAAHLVASEDLGTWQAETRRAVADEVDRSGALAYPPFEVYPPTAADEVLAIDYIEPQASNERAFGLDFLSEQNRRDAASRARDTGAPAATAPITLVQETGEQRAILVMVPLYGPGRPPSTLAERQARFEGVVYAAFRMGDLLDAALAGEDTRVTEIVDVESGEALYISERPSDATAEYGPELHRDLEIAGRDWAVSVAVVGSALSPLERVLPWMILLGGLLIAALIAGLVASIVSSTATATNLAREMTTELEAITEAAVEAIISVDSQGTIVAWNRGATDVFGAGPKEMLGRSVLALVPERFHHAFRTQLDAVVAGEAERLAGASVDLVARRQSGEEFPLELSVSRWTARGTVFVTGFAHDLTERVEAQQRLQRTTELLVGLLGAATEMSIIATDPDGTITVFNRGAELMLGHEASTVVGTATPALIHDPDEVVERAHELGIEPGFDVFVHAARKGQAETRTWTYVRRDGERLPVDLTVTPMHDHDGELRGFIGIAIDVTERRRSEQLRQAALVRQQEMLRKLTELDRAKSDFVSTMSHELRTPLTSIIGFSELLAEELGEDEDAEDRRLVGLIERNAERLLSLVEDLLALSRIESGAFRLHRERIDCAATVQSACEAVGPVANRRGVEISCRTEGPLPVDADRPQLERVFLNLLTNAVKFSHVGGSIEVEAGHDGDEVTVVVRDHGIGIASEEQAQVFTRFFRARSAEERSINGTGLGLAIVENIVQRHSGTVSLRSTEGVGTTLTVRLPYADVAPQAPRMEEVST